MHRNSQIIKLFGLKQGLTHSEFIVDNTDGEIYLIETAARGGGAFISSGIIPLASDVNSEKFLLSIALGECEQKPHISFNHRPCCYLAFRLPKGRIINIQGIEEVKNLSYVHQNNLDDFYIGAEIEKTTSKAGRGLMVIDASDKDELYSRINIVRLILRIDVLNDGETHGIIWQ